MYNSKSTPGTRLVAVGEGSREVLFDLGLDLKFIKFMFENEPRNAQYFKSGLKTRLNSTQEDFRFSIKLLWVHLQK